jgi:hypothetical protein
MRGRVEMITKQEQADKSFYLNCRKDGICRTNTKLYCIIISLMFYEDINLMVVKCKATHLSLHSHIQSFNNQILAVPDYIGYTTQARNTSTGRSIVQCTDVVHSSAQIFAERY